MWQYQTLGIYLSLFRENPFKCHIFYTIFAT
jgi:hypothetical protein